MEFVIKGTIKGIGEKGSAQGWEFREVLVVNGKDTFRVCFWGQYAEIPLAYNQGDEVEIACEFRSEEKINTQTGKAYVATRINGWAIKAVFKGTYVSDYLKAKHINDPQGNQDSPQIPL